MGLDMNFMENTKPYTTEFSIDDEILYFSKLYRIRNCILKSLDFKGGDAVLVNEESMWKILSAIYSDFIVLDDITPSEVNALINIIGYTEYLLSLARQGRLIYWDSY